MPLPEAMRERIQLSDEWRYAQLANLIEAWGRNAAYHFVFTRQNRGKLDALTALVERGLVKPVVGAILKAADLRNPSAINYYFKSKACLVEDLVAELRTNAWPVVRLQQLPAAYPPG